MKKQDDMRKKYSNDKIKFYIGDVRDKSSLNEAMKNVDYIFMTALKQVPSCEFSTSSNKQMYLVQKMLFSLLLKIT